MTRRDAIWGWHFVGADLRLSHDASDVTVAPGYVYTYEGGPLQHCEDGEARGLFACRSAFDALGYSTGPVICRVRSWGDVIERGDKLVSRHREVVAVANVESEIRLWACWCVRQVWHLLTDERSRRVVKVAEAFALGQATREELSAAGAAAWAAMDAAGAAAGAAAWAAMAAAWAAMAAAWDAARGRRRGRRLGRRRGRHRGRRQGRRKGRQGCSARRVRAPNAGGGGDAVMTRREWLLAAKADIALALLRTRNAIDYLREDANDEQAKSAGLPWLTCAHEDLRTADARIDAALDGCER